MLLHIFLQNNLFQPACGILSPEISTADYFSQTFANITGVYGVDIEDEEINIHRCEEINLS